MKKKSSKRPIFLMIATVILCMPLIWLANNYFVLERAFDNMIDGDETNIALAASKQEGFSSDKRQTIRPFSVLLLGVDEREHDVGRSDTMIVLTVNPALGTMKMLSIPRDTRAEIVGLGTVEKINHAYAHGGVDMARATVENFLQMPIDFYVKVNMEGFLHVIDTFDGVTIHNDLALTYKEYDFAEGAIALTGEEALIYSRIRYEDPRGDFGRQTRQRLLLQAILAEAQQPANVLLKLDDLIGTLGESIRMNFTKEQLMTLLMHYPSFEKDIEQLQLQKGTGQTIDGLWYYIVDENELYDVQQTLQQHLDAT
ncbi:LCP family protein [Caryophanon latum]|nr:LCP family protein [Caryophanon latum]